MSFLMSSKFCLLVKVFATVFALIRLLLSRPVSIFYMHGQVSFVAKRFATVFAPIRFLPCVRSCMANLRFLCYWNICQSSQLHVFSLVCILIWLVKPILLWKPLPQSLHRHGFSLAEQSGFIDRLWATSWFWYSVALSISFCFDLFSCEDR